MEINQEKKVEINETKYRWKSKNSEKNDTRNLLRKDIRGAAVSKRRRINNER